MAAGAMGAVAGSGFSILILGLVDRQLHTQAPPQLWMGGAFLLFVVLYYLLSTGSEYLLLSLAQQEMYELRLRLSRHVLSMPLKRIEEIGGPDFMASLTHDPEQLTASLHKLPTLFVSGAMVLGAGAYAAWLSWRLFLVTMVLMTVGLLAYRHPLGKLQLLDRYWASLREGWDRLFRHLHALTHGTKELLLHRDRREVFLDRCVRRTAEELRNDTVRAKAIQHLFFRLGDVLWLLVLGVILFLLPRWISIDHDVLSGYLVVGLFLASPVASLLNFGPNFGEALVAMERLRALGVPLTGEVVAPETGTASLPAQADEVVPVSDEAPGLVRLEGVTYRYRRESDDEEFVLGPIDLEIQQEETTFLVGGNGSGKTTLLKLLCGLYVPESGHVYWRGEEITDENRETYRQLFTVVFSDFYLFDMLFGLESVTLDGRARTYLERLHLDRKVRVEDGRLSTVNLSQGQRKRLALLTAYLEDRPLYLFDEWAADQDPVFKEVFYRELLPELAERGKTLLVITHDDAWYGQADRIVKVREGQIIEDRRPVTA